VRPRQDLGQSGVEDMITLRDINEASILWNLRLRYDNKNIYTFIGTILISVNPYRAFDDEGESLYGLKSVAKYDGQSLGLFRHIYLPLALPPWLVRWPIHGRMSRLFLMARLEQGRRS
ncbi:Myosin 15, partial [Caligus rogercresseyi]